MQNCNVLAQLKCKKSLILCNYPSQWHSRQATLDREHGPLRALNHIFRFFKAIPDISHWASWMLLCKLLCQGGPFGPWVEVFSSTSHTKYSGSLGQSASWHLDMCEVRSGPLNPQLGLEEFHAGVHIMDATEWGQFLVEYSQVIQDCAVPLSGDGTHWWKLLCFHVIKQTAGTCTAAKASNASKILTLMEYHDV